MGPAVLIGALVGGFLFSNSFFFSAAALGVAVGGLYVSWRGFAFLVDGLDGAVAYVSAPLSCRSVRTKNGMNYFADIGPVTRSINSNAFSSLPQVPCHLYYAPSSRSLLSVEPATAAEPLPAHPFGPDSAHVWDRLRWSWVFITVGALGLPLGAHSLAIAHPAHPYAVGGTISSYYEHHGKGGTTRNLYLGDDPNAYAPKSEDGYSPVVPGFDVLVGHEVVLYVNQGTRDILALRDADQLYVTDWYVHPEHETQSEAGNALATIALSVLMVLGGIGGIAVGRRQMAAAAATPASAPPDPTFAQTPMLNPSSMSYMPPTVRPLQANLAPSLVFLGVALAVWLALVVGGHTAW